MDATKLPESKEELIKLLKDIHGYYSIKIPIWFLVLLVLILIGAGVFVYFKYFHKKKQDPLTNFEQTLRELKSLDVKAPSKLFYLEFAEIVKLYLQTEFELHLLDKTTEEIKEVLLNQPLFSTAQVLQLTKSLARGDLAKFAMQEISLEDKAEDIDRALRLVTEINTMLVKQREYEALMAKREFNASDLSKIPFDEQRELAEISSGSDSNGGVKK